MVCSKFTKLRNYHRYLIPENFNHPQGNSIPIKEPLLIFPSLSPLGNQNLFFVSMDLLNLDISYK